MFQMCFPNSHLAQLQVVARVDIQSVCFCVAVVDIHTQYLNFQKWVQEINGNDNNQAYRAKNPSKEKLKDGLVHKQQ